MHDPRTSTALRQLADLGDQPDPPRWSWAIVQADDKGRVLLPKTARAVLGAFGIEPTPVRLVCNRVAAVVRPDGAGALTPIDRRGRLLVPVWLRRAPTRSVVVGSCCHPPMVVVAPTAVFDGFGDLLSGTCR